ncbi:hypothetical protein ACHAWF_005332 [Thalassiosira exigua]
MGLSDVASYYVDEAAAGSTLSATAPEWRPSPAPVASIEDDADGTKTINHRSSGPFFSWRPTSKGMNVRKIVTRNVEGCGFDENQLLQAVVNTMESSDEGAKSSGNSDRNKIDAFLLQGTGWSGSWKRVIHSGRKRPIKATAGSYLVLHHNAKVHDNSQQNDAGDVTGVAIILSPEFHNAYERAGRPRPVQTQGEFMGRFIGTYVSFPLIDSYGKRIKPKTKSLYIFLGSALHPVDEERYSQFNDCMSKLMICSAAFNKHTSNTLIGHHINASVGIRDNESVAETLGHYGIDSVDSKGELARHFFMRQNLRVLNTYYSHKKYRTNMRSGDDILMMNICTSSKPVYKLIRNCKLFEHSIPGHYTGVVVDINLTSIKHTGGRRAREKKEYGEKHKAREGRQSK